MSSHRYSIPIVGSPIYYSSLDRYTKNHFGFMNFNPPLSDNIQKPSVKSQEKIIEFQPSYDTLIRGNGLSHCNYASVKDAYESSYIVEK